MNGRSAAIPTWHSHLPTKIVFIETIPTWHSHHPFPPSTAEKYFAVQIAFKVGLVALRRVRQSQK